MSMTECAKRWLKALPPAFVAVMLAALLAGCTEFITPTPAETPTATVEATQQPDQEITPSPTPGDLVFSSGLPTPVPIIYKMFDWGTDYQTRNPELGPIGSIQFCMWEDINPAKGVYDWSAIDSKLALEAPLKVTLPDGRQIPKPVVIQVFPYISSYPGWSAEYYDGTPTWVYDLIDAQNPSDPRPKVNGRKVGHALTGCGKTAVLPMYDNATWRQAYYDMVAAFGARYNNNAQVTSVVINTGLDGETQPVKDLTCPWNTYLDQQANGVRYRFQQFILEAMTVFRKAFPTKPIFINNAPGGSGMRKLTSDWAATFNPPIGLKHSGMWVDLDSHQGYGNFYGSWDLIREYSQTLPIWLESPFGLGGKEQRYWSFIAGLHYHPDAIDVHPEYLTQSEPEWLHFTVRHLGVSLQDTPDVWIVLRDSEYELQSWGSGGVSGHVGDWTFWLYQNESAPQSATTRVWRDEMPAARTSVYSRQARRTQQTANQVFMSFNIDDGYPYVNQKPLDVAGGNVHYIVHVTILNTGNDTFALQYRNWDGGIVSQVRTKGAALGAVNDWVTVPFVVRDGYFNNGMPGGSDFRISCERDGDEYIHMVRVEGGWGTPPTPTATPKWTNTPRPTATGQATATTAFTTPTLTPPPAGTPTPRAGAIRLDPAADTTLDQWAPTENTNSQIKLSVRQGDAKATLLRFDLSSIPAGSTIERAELQLAILGRTNSGALNVAAHKVLRPWDASTTTWNLAAANTPWAVAGCNDPTSDRSSVEIAKETLSYDNAWYTWDITALAQEWVNDPTKNYGLALKGSGAASVQYDFYASEHTTGAMRPRLWVVISSGTPLPPTIAPTPSETIYHTPGPTPTPSNTAPPTNTPEPAPTSVTFRQGQDSYAGAEDTYLDAWSEDVNFADSQKLIARQGSLRAPLMRFDLSSIPNYASVKQATLYLYATSRSNPSAITLSVAKVNRAWSPEAVTWNQATASEAWFQPGAQDVGSDRSARIYDSELLAGERSWTTWDVTDLVQEWVSDPERNYGLLILSQGDVSVQYDLTTSSWGNSQYRPHLLVQYLPVAPSPTPIATFTPTPTFTPAATPTPTMTPFPPSGEHIFQQGIEGYQGYMDTYIDRWNPQLNNAAGHKLVIRPGDVRTALLRLNLEALPISSKINRALLLLYVQARSGPHAISVEARGLARPWTAHEATFQRASAAQAWAAEGATSLGSDVTAVSASGAATAEGAWVTLDITTLVQEWVTFPERNLGLAIRAVSDVSVQYDFASSEWPHNAALRPKLYVNWEPAPPTPTVTGTPPTPTFTPTPTATATETPTPTPTRRRVKLALQQGLARYAGVTDTYLDGWNQQANMGQHGTFSIRQDGIRTALIRYELAVPSEAKVTQASLSLWLAYASNPGQVTLRAYRLLRPWDENTANWLEAEAGSLWAAPGAGGADRLAEPVGQVSLAGAQKWVEIDLTSAAQYWAQHPGENFGVVLVSAGGVSVEHQFASSQWQEQDQRPKLGLTYELEPVVNMTLQQQAKLPSSASGYLVAGVGALMLVALLRGAKRRA